MTFKFEPSDFESVSVHEFNGFGRGLLESEKEQICNFANKKFNTWLESQKDLYAMYEDSRFWDDVAYPMAYQFKAKLVCVERLEK